MECVDNCKLCGVLLYGLADLISIREFTGPDFPVFMYDGEGNHKMMTMDEVSGIREMDSNCLKKSSTNRTSYSLTPLDQIS